ncbi:MTAP family purine nucleoside phosphorylase [Nitrospina watsonii]|uniref:Probable 6-oxopurine nucleoside phosphorylase n=1 Tax=Nitrospina watsonii TaxID=1323948 RepID=A0ABM9HGR2_9BACT|nr:MTAP family purine nucleoside phosphorylase [Nitrospina watsonii]CAI2719519.1 Purine nucleoside phosphorylase [Nitrospina watsonii]
MQASLAVIGGSGAYHLLTRNLLGEEVDCASVETPFGASAPLHEFRAGDSTFLFLSRHGETDYSLTAPFVNYRANIYALKACGVRRIVAWSGPGIINRAYRPGEFVLPHDVIDETRNRESTFFKERGIGFIRQSDPFCPEVRDALHESMHHAGLPHHEQGVYVCTQGPRLESPAEIKKFRIVGADLVGMTLCPEAFLARELEMCYAPVCYLTNYAEGVVQRDFKKGELFEGMQSGEEKTQVDAAIQQFPLILAGAFSQLAGEDAQCHCPHAMQRYRDKGMIGGDWKSWLGPV